MKLLSQKKYEGPIEVELPFDRYSDVREYMMHLLDHPEKVTDFPEEVAKYVHTSYKEGGQSWALLNEGNTIIYRLKTIHGNT